MYCVGTLFARSLYQISQKLSLDSPTFISELLAMFPEIKREYEAASAGTKRITESTDTSDYTYLARLGLSTSKFLASFIKVAPIGWRSSMCTAFIDNFSNKGFVTELRTTCEN